jgi:hypothetical protein
MARIADIAHQGMDAWECSFGGLQLLLVATRDDYRITAPMKFLCQLKTDAARSSGYQNRSLLQLHKTS